MQILSASGDLPLELGACLRRPVGLMITSRLQPKPEMLWVGSAVPCLLSISSSGLVDIGRVKGVCVSKEDRVAQLTDNLVPSFLSYSMKCSMLTLVISCLLPTVLQAPLCFVECVATSVAIELKVCRSSAKGTLWQINNCAA